MASATNAVNIPADDSSDEEETNQPFVPFNERPEWKDITPVPQDEGPNPVAVIQYTPRFANTFDYFRAILEKDERSERALDLTTECIQLNPANYTVWYFRREVLKDLKTDLSEELDFMDDIINRHNKNYQVWHHRKCICEMMGDASREKKFTQEILELDSKNYHAWQHRQWVVKSFNDWEGEIEYTDILIHDDVRNNSAWNHRHFVISNTSGWNDTKVIDREVDYTLGKIKLAPNNESPWNYLRGVLDRQGLNSVPRVTIFCQDMLEKPPNAKVSPHLVGFIIDAIEERLEKRQEAGGGDEESLLIKATTLCDQLAKEWDPIRVNYWDFIKAGLKEKYGEKKEESMN
jgi:protein farnesyltransferase/geranylgeranyltransferase type-1 subunit alpha